MDRLKRLAIAVVALALFAVSVPAEAGLLDKFRGGRGGGGDECADGSCGRPIGMGLKKPGAEVGTVTGDGMFVKMYAAQPEPEQPVIVQPAPEPAKENDVHPIVLLLATCPLALLFLIGAPTGTYFVARAIQERDSD